MSHQSADKSKGCTKDLHGIRWIPCNICNMSNMSADKLLFIIYYNSRCSVHGFHVNRVASSHGVCAIMQITPIKCFSCIQVKLGQCLSEWGSSWSLPRYYWREATLARRFSVGIFSLKFSFRSWLVQILYYSAILLFRSSIPVLYYSDWSFGYSDSVTTMYLFQLEFRDHITTRKKQRRPYCV